MPEFSNPYLLFLTLPIIILLFILHFINIRPKELVIPSIIFLKEFKLRSYKKFNLIKFLLFVLRSLIITFLIFGFSNPHLKGIKEENPIIIILDTSISMKGITQYGITAFEYALDFLRDNFSDRKIIIAGYSDRIDFVEFSIKDFKSVDRKNSFLNINTAIIKLLNEAKKISDKKPYLIFISDMHGWDLRLSNEVIALFEKVVVLKIPFENSDGIIDVSSKRVLGGFEFYIKRISQTKKKVYIYSKDTLIKTTYDDEVFIDTPLEVMRFEIDPDAYMYDDFFSVAFNKQILTKWSYIGLSTNEKEYIETALKTIGISFTPYSKNADVVVTSDINKIMDLNFKKAIVFLKEGDFSSKLLEGNWRVKPVGELAYIDFEWDKIRINKLLGTNIKDGLLITDDGYPVIFKRVFNNREFYFFASSLEYDASNIGLKPFFPYFVYEVSRVNLNNVNVENTPREESFLGRANIEVKDIDKFEFKGYSLSRHMVLAALFLLLIEVLLIRAIA